jgi:hypothetical protein
MLRGLDFRDLPFDLDLDLDLDIVIEL